MAKAKKSKAKKQPKKKAKKTAKRAAAKARRAPTKKSKAKKSRAKKSRKAAAPRKAKKAAPRKKKKQQIGEGDYAASRTFLKDQANFVKKNKARIPAMGKEAERALDGPEGDSLRAAEQEAMNRSTME
jgi:hypothetical protein